MDPQCRTIVTKVAEHLHYQGLKLVNANLQEYNQPADVVLALALVHWVYSCTANFGSLDAVIAWLASDASDYVNGQALVIDGGMTLYSAFRGGG